MKNKILFIIGIFSFPIGSIYAQEMHEKDPHYEWFEGDEVAILVDGVYTDSIKGMVRLNVVDYDRVNNRYKVICNCLKRPELDPTEALSIPYEVIFQ